MVRIFVGIILFSAILLGCSDKKHEGIYDEGRIEYRIKYLNAEKDNYDPAFLPKKMILEFNQEFSINRIDGFMGFFKLGNITYFRKKKVKTHLKVLDQNYTFNGGRNEMMCCFDCMSDMVILEDTLQSEMAGLLSKRARVTFEGSEDTFDIYYTSDINLNEPNASNPYRKVDGVLTKFRLIMGPYNMEFTASKFNPGQPPKEELDIPTNATSVNRAEMVAILNRLMEQNM